MSEHDNHDVATIRSTKGTVRKLKKFSNFLSDRRYGKFISMEDTLRYLVSRLEVTDLEEYNLWLFNEDIQLKSKDEILDELQREKELGEAMFNTLCASCQRHTAEIVEAMG